MTWRTQESEGTLLSVSNREKGAVTYTIGKVKGRGMSGIVYDASYLDNRGYRHAVLIKECYPFEADIYRDGDRLVPGSELDERIFRECRSEMEASYGLHNELFHTSGLTNYISNTIDNYTQNNTIYYRLDVPGGRGALTQEDRLYQGMRDYREERRCLPGQDA